jgi:hypothetical protein
MKEFIPVVWIPGLAALLLAGCVSSHKPATLREPTVIAETQRYRIVKSSETEFLVHAWSTKEAQQAINDILGCGKRICIVAPAGVVFSIERFEKKP